MIEFNSFMEFNKSISDRDISFIRSVTDLVIKAIDNDEEKVTIFSTPDIFGDEILSFTVSKEQYKKLLSKSVKDFENEEMYEECSIIQEYLSKL